MVHIGCGTWQYSKSGAFITAMVCLQFINYRFWWATYAAIITALTILLPLFPRLANHSNLEVFICIISIGMLLAKLLFKLKLPRPHTVNLTFRLFLITIYFIAGFHKLNSGFFNADGSCSATIGATFNQMLYGGDFRFPPVVTKGFQLFTFFIEMVVPFGLLFKRFRTACVVLLACFHFYLSLYGFANFSAFAAFLITGSILNLEQALPAGVLKGLRYYILFCVPAVVGCYVISRFNLGGIGEIKVYCGVVFNVGWVIYFYYLLRYNTATTLHFTFSWWQPATVVLAGMWGLQCYAGLSTAGTLSMFSNLITLKGRSNHYLIDTNKTKIWDFEEDNVTIIEIPNKCTWNNGKPLKGYILPTIEFKSSVKKWSARYNEALPCTLVYKGRKLFIPDLRTSQFNKTEWWYRYLYYRRIPVEGNECQW